MAIHSDDRRQQLCDWLTANGIDPNEVPDDADIVTAEGEGARFLRCEVFVCDAPGHFALNERGDAAAREMRTVALAVEPPDWWQPHVKPTREQLTEQLDAVYRERAHLVAHLAAILPSVMADDPSDPDWRIVYLDTPAGQCSWHIARSDLDLFTHVPDGAPVWDGHTTDEKYQRVRDFTAAVVQTRTSA